MHTLGARLSATSAGRLQGGVTLALSDAICIYSSAYAQSVSKGGVPMHRLVSVSQASSQSKSCMHSAHTNSTRVISAEGVTQKRDSQKSGCCIGHLTGNLP